MLARARPCFWTVAWLWTEMNGETYLYNGNFNSQFTRFRYPLGVRRGFLMDAALITLTYLN